jgi:DMSO/TMAO reductase YedYZ heme-binding membrane subunit
LIYVSAICAVVHFIWKGKVIVGDPVLYAGILTALLGFRVVRTLRLRMSSPAPRPRTDVSQGRRFSSPS